MSRRICVVAFAAAAALISAVPALAFDCTVAKKPATAGAVVLINVNTGDETVLKPNPGTDDQIHGAFIALTDGSISTSTFVHAPQGVLPPVRDGGPQADCDGKGLDSLEVCFGE
jgi:hypothetical protein